MFQIESMGGALGSENKELGWYGLQDWNWARPREEVRVCAVGV